jgi:hypothetical protein
MGYRKQRTIYDLTFAKYEGLEVSLHGLNTGQTMDLWAAKNDGGPEATAEMLAMFSDSLRDWNLETEEGEPVPPDLKGVRSQELSFVLELIDSWTTAMTGANEDLGKESTSGETSPEAGIPTEPL